MKHFKKIYVLTDEYPRQIQINNKTFNRIMYRFYKCVAMGDMDEDCSIELSEIRRNLMKSTVKRKYNEFIIRQLIDKGIEGQSGGIILDYGVGTGISFDIIREYNGWQLMGYDISTKNMDRLKKKGYAILDWRKNYLSFKFDVIISSFVFIYNVSVHEIKIINLLLKRGGKLVFNLYPEHKAHNNNIIGLLQKYGLSCEKRYICIPEHFKVYHEKNIIVICIKL